MDREEKFISDKFGHRTPFKVPDGYFDDLTSRIMQNIPERSHPVEEARIVGMGFSRWRRLRPIAIAAASICVAVFGMGIYLHGGDKGTAVVHTGQMNDVPLVSPYSTVDAIADYAMLDTEDMYAYMEDDD